ncbi:SpoIIE family protein phosphatase [Thermomonospora umbrina]|uniref:Serine phosphatase RsbU (Regulator of sigma subunit) n=1 Tax=Thermomonospora umbrina TaxID=111806 RepID=A0A3D9SUF4_9ACTN|nr:SpoIIE family protein phosphatase [Thermomonospora umbrina]REE97653.1 serine phosphatase RsbU (regulator of sigma subunit) [Thermomonospora umbrina]
MAGRLSGEGPPGDADRVGRLADTVRRLRAEIEKAQAAADGRALIALAKGVLVERLRCGPAEAARQLEALAGESGRSPLELAAEIIDQAAQDRLTEAARDLLAGTRPGDADAGSSVTVRLRTAEAGALAAADAQSVADSLLEHALAPLGAKAVAVWSAGHDSSLTLVGAAGFSTGEPARWRYVPPGVVTPARSALAERAPQWYPRLDLSGLPSIGHGDFPFGGRVAVPAGTGGRILGVLEICWPEELEPQPPQVERQIEALAELCAHTLETRDASPDVPAVSAVSAGREVLELVDLADGLHDPALVLRPRLDDGGRLTDFRIQHANTRFVDPAGRPRGALDGALLLESYPLAAGERGLFEIVERVYATGEAFRAERMTLTALVGQVPLAGVADLSVSRVGAGILLIWRIEDETARLARLLQHAQRLVRIGGFEEETLTGQVAWNPELFALYGLEEGADPVPLRRLPDHAHPDDDAVIGRFLRSVLYRHRPASAAFRLLRGDGITRHMRVVAEPVLDPHGHLQAVRGAYQDISAQHWTEVALAATRDRLAHTEQQAAERNRLARQLQEAIMPPARAPINALGLRVATRYRPAEKDHLVGGDWYDAVVLPSKQVLLCVGDVAGHGIEAATDMVVLRNALRGLATTGAGPAQLLTWLNQVAHHLTDNVTATALCALYDPSAGTLRWARAGHLPPVLVRGDEATLLPMVGGLLLGALADADYEEAELSLRSGDVLLMFTDGLVERRDTSMQESMEHLLVNAGTASATLEQRLDTMLNNSNADTDDDTCLVGVQLP